MGELQLFGTAWVIACDHRAVGEVCRSPRLVGGHACILVGKNRRADRWDQSSCVPNYDTVGPHLLHHQRARLGGHRTPPPCSLRFDMCDGGVPAGHDAPLPPEIIRFWIKAAISEGLLIDVISQTKWLTKRPRPKPLRFWLGDYWPPIFWFVKRVR